uniref:Uncharacterized protein n=1 Tax=Chromera velia CCMP2878 TaxID=1169474 RepID=A0A0G4HLN2_9ALVE|eukprot:Cvel_1154.t1-p1 / transcript=Cvel_1154.t1 / gene=Cvel_1154 / organism=Chromera_velia_CCMP2878 / gene_product=Uncharacterized oxidoreductase C736.13, putative / transcript_product=Uncharacterized oxidoreductase C736.13, putative / location=Cvel_scaffold38:78635-79720(+) / protein_length=362 / sequence_SO=supercontig / SO=protein_coding / is_pseudo=false
MGCCESQPTGVGADVKGPAVLADKYYPEYIKDPSKIKDLTGKVALITGVSTASGLGYYITKGLAFKGAACVITVRTVSKGEAVKSQLETELQSEGVTVPSITVMKMDNCNFASVRSFAEEFKSKFDRLDILCNNAGVMALPYELTGDGFEVQVQTNHLSHFLMTALLWPLIKQTAETHGEVAINQVSSGASTFGSPSVDTKNLNNQHPPHGMLLGLAPCIIGGKTDMWARYGQSKLCNYLFAMELQRRADAAGLSEKVRSTCAHPGLAATNLQMTTQQQGGMKDGQGLQKRGHSCADGSLPMLMALAHPTLSAPGVYYGPEQNMTGPPMKGAPQTNKNAHDTRLAAALWEASEKACAETFAV